MHLNFKLSFEHFDFNDDEFLNDLKRLNHFYSCTSSFVGPGILSEEHPKSE